MPKIAFGRHYQSVNLEESNILGVIEPKDSFRSINSFQTPKNLELLLHSNKKIVIVVPDNTRNCHLKTILTPLLHTMDKHKCSPRIIIATGLHNKPNESQLEEMFGKSILQRYPVTSHVQEPGQITDLGHTKSGIPITLNNILFDQKNLLITIGVVEPHLYAGFSGGPKTIAIGLAGEQTINATHSLKFLNGKKTRLCATHSNPFHQTLWEIISSIKVDYTISVVNNSKGEPIKIFAGSLKSSFNKAINFISNNYIINVEKPADLLICGLGFPKDINLYQASRVINYSLDVENPIVRKGGIIIIAAELSEEIGQGLGEIRFYHDLTNMTNIKSYIKKAKQSGFIAGGHRTFMTAKHLNDYKVVFVSSKMELFKNTPFICYPSIEEAIDYAKNKLGRNMSTYIYPKTLNSIARIVRS